VLDMNATKEAGTGLSYGEAYQAWRDSCERYLALARSGASATTLREAAAAIHQAALQKGRLARDSEDTEH
jgi:hypothetical protein